MNMAMHQCKIQGTAFIMLHLYVNCMYPSCYTIVQANNLLCLGFLLEPNYFSLSQVQITMYSSMVGLNSFNTDTQKKYDSFFSFNFVRNSVDKLTLIYTSIILDGAIYIYFSYIIACIFVKFSVYVFDSSVTQITLSEQMIHPLSVITSNRILLECQLMFSNRISDPNKYFSDEYK